MANYLLLFRSLTAAQRAEKTLRRKGIITNIFRVPSEIPTNGCAYCIKIEESQLNHILSILKNSEQTPTKIFAWFGSGNFREV